MSPTLFLFVTFALIAVGGFLIARGLHGPVVFTEPRCTKCNYDLRTFRFDLDDSPRAAPASVAEPDAARPAGPSAAVPYQGRRCPECGADLSAPNAVTFGRRGKRPRLVAAGAGLLALPVLLMLALAWAPTRRGIGAVVATPGAPADKSTATLLSELKTPANASQPWNWQELERRHAAGTLSAAETSEAVERLIAYAATMGAAGGNQPLTWAEPLLKRLDAAGVVTPEQYARLAAAYYGAAPKVTITRRLRPGTTVMFNVEYGGHWDLPDVTFVKAVRDVRVDGDAEKNTGTKVAPHDHEADPKDADPDWLSRDGVRPVNGSIALPPDLPPGKHELVFTVDAGVLSEPVEFTAVNRRPGQRERWSGVRCTWPATVRVPFELLAPDASPVALVTDPALDPVASGTIPQPTLKVRRTRSGLTFEVFFKGAANKPALPFVADLSVGLGGQTFRTTVSRSATSWYGDATLGFTLRSLPPDATRADVVLRPNVKLAEQDPAVDRIWGEEIRFEGVPVERHDLPVSPAPASSPAVPPSH